MSVQFFGHVKLFLLALGVDEERVRIGGLVWSIQEMQTRLQLLNFLLLQNSLVDNVPGMITAIQFSMSLIQNAQYTTVSLSGIFSRPVVNKLDTALIIQSKTTG